MVVVGIAVKVIIVMMVKACHKMMYVVDTGVVVVCCNLDIDVAVDVASHYYYYLSNSSHCC